MWRHHSNTPLSHAPSAAGPWDLFGIYLGSLWDLSGIYLGSIWGLFGLVVAVAAVPLDVARQGDALAREVLLGRLGSHQVLRMSVGIRGAVRVRVGVGVWGGIGMMVRLG